MLTEAQKSGFWEDGVVVVDWACSANELEPLRVQHRRWIDESRQHDGPFGEMLDGRPRFDVEPRHSASAPALRRVASPEEISDDYLQLIQGGTMLEAVADLLDDDLRFHHAKLNSKLPGRARHWPIWGAPFGPARKQPSALLCSLELATASPAVARLAADCFLTGCIHQSLVVRPLVCQE